MIIGPIVVLFKMFIFEELFTDEAKDQHRIEVLALWRIEPNRQMQMWSGCTRTRISRHRYVLPCTNMLSNLHPYL